MTMRIRSSDALQLRLLGAQRDSGGEDRANRKAKRAEVLALNKRAAKRTRDRAGLAKDAITIERDWSIAGTTFGVITGVAMIVVGAVIKNPKLIQKGVEMPNVGRKMGEAAGALSSEGERRGIAQAIRDSGEAEAEAEVMDKRGGDARRATEDRRDRSNNIAEALMSADLERDAVWAWGD